MPRRSAAAAPAAPAAPARLKRGTRIIYTHAGGVEVPGVVTGPYGNGLGPDWYALRLRDAGGSYRGGGHRDQIRLDDTPSED